MFQDCERPMKAPLAWLIAAIATVIVLKSFEKPTACAADQLMMHNDFDRCVTDARD